MSFTRCFIPNSVIFWSLLIESSITKMNASFPGFGSRWFPCEDKEGVHLTVHCLKREEGWVRVGRDGGVGLQNRRANTASSARSSFWVYLRAFAVDRSHGCPQHPTSCGTELKYVLSSPKLPPPPRLLTLQDHSYPWLAPIAIWFPLSSSVTIFAHGRPVAVLDLNSTLIPQVLFSVQFDTFGHCLITQSISLPTYTRIYIFCFLSTTLSSIFPPSCYNFFLIVDSLIPSKGRFFSVSTILGPWCLLTYIRFSRRFHSSLSFTPLSCDLGSDNFSVNTSTDFIDDGQPMHYFYS